MAKRRMLSRRISQSKKVNKLSLKAQLVYTWTIPYLDDYGCYTADTDDIKTEVLPKNKRISETGVKNALAELQAGDLIIIYEVNGRHYQKYNEFETFQTFKSDRERKHEYPAYKEGLETVGNQRKPLEPIREVKLSKVKLSKEKKKVRFLDFVFLTKAEYSKLAKKFGNFNADEKIATLNEGIGSKGYKYNSHYFTILSWARKDKKDVGNRTKNSSAQRNSTQRGSYAEQESQYGQTIE